MFALIIVAILVFAGLAYARLTGQGQLIWRHPYANRYNDAAGAREDHLG